MYKITKNVIFTASFALAAPALAQTPAMAEADDNATEAMDDLLDMSLEELLAQEVTSVAKKARRVGDSAAAVTVISQDDIRRSSARTVPDLLRMVPGMEVAEIQASSTSVSARGFTSRFASNLLVMVDGASIYSTSISGMFWDMALIPLQDIERIEVIRGPGGSLWGSNAVSGVVNIITKQSVDTQGVRANGSIGTQDKKVEAGFGQQLSDSLSFRIYGNYRETDGLDGPNGERDGDWSKGGLGGVRFDFAPSAQDSLVFTAEHSTGEFQDRFVDVVFDPLAPREFVTIQDNRFSSTHVLARWTHIFSPDLDVTLQAYYNNLQRTELEAEVNRDLFDVSVEGRWKAGDAHELNFGLAGRIARDLIVPSATLRQRDDTAFNTGDLRNTDRWLTGYLQDDITLIPDTLRLTLGTKFEQNNFTGTELQPSARLFYRASEDFAAWASVTRAVRTPLLIQRELAATVSIVRPVEGFPGPVPIRVVFSGSEDVESEVVTSYELGVRGNLFDNWSYDVAAHYARYDDMLSLRSSGQEPIFAMGIPFPIGVQSTNVFGNFGEAESYGIEAVLAGPLTDWWKIETSYSFLDLETPIDPGDTPLAPDYHSPKHQFRLASNMQVADNVSIDAEVHHVSEAAQGRRPAYTDLDLRLTSQLNSNVEVSVVGSNLLDKRRLEYVNETLPVEFVYVPRSAFIETRVRF